MDSLYRIFFNDARRLRSGLRVVVFVGVFLVLFFFVTAGVRLGYALVTLVAPEAIRSARLQDLVFRLILITSSLGAGYLCARFLEGLPWRSLGLTFHARWLRDLIIGSLIGIASLALSAVIAFAAGGLRFSISSAGVRLVITTVIVSAVAFIVAALAEETLFRGYPMQTFARARLAWLGILLTSVPFATVHLDNPNAGSLIAFVNTVLAGVWLAVAYLKTRSLWFPLGVHWAWNWALGALFGLPVSGTTSVTPNPILVGNDLGPAWLTGARYGIEGGVACTIALAISTFFIWRTSLVSANDDLKRLTSEENAVAAAADSRRQEQTARAES